MKSKESLQLEIILTKIKSALRLLENVDDHRAKFVRKMLMDSLYENDIVVDESQFDMGAEIL